MKSFKALLLTSLLITSSSGLGGGCPIRQFHSFLSGSATIPRSTPEAIAMAAFAASATPVEVWAVTGLEGMYHQATTIKCPFFRRRASDILDATDMMAKFLLVRHKSMELPLGCRVESSMSLEKKKDLSATDLFNIILADWKTNTNKGYYITGRLNSTIYREDCLFDGPDPDMPVRGLRKYLNAASQLFDYSSSYAMLDSLEVKNSKLLIARWKMAGTLRLPWRPALAPFAGATFYHLDDNNLVFKHEETWDMSVMEAFVMTLAPSLGKRIWKPRPNDLLEEIAASRRAAPASSAS